MRRRQKAADGVVLPPELRHRPTTDARIGYWLAQPPTGQWDPSAKPEYWDDRLWPWREVCAHHRWSRARHEWRAGNDPSYWWYRRRAG